MRTSTTTARDARVGRVGRVGGRLVAAALLACAGACDFKPEPPRTFSEARIVEPAGEPARRNATSAERFGLRAPERTSSALRWETPTGWVETAPGAMRAASFRVAGDERAECSLTVLPGDAGGLAANVDRWRQQMSLAPLPPSELDALPRGELLGRAAVLLDLEGNWTGMGGGEAQTGWRMVGLLAVGPEGSLFLKMTGPKSVIDGETGAFHTLARSFAQGPGARGSGAESAGMQADVRAQDDEPHADAHAAAGGEGRAAGLRWHAPAGWMRAPERAFRVVSFRIGAGGAAECYVTVLAGDGGGLAANANRWRQQIGAPALSADELARLARVPMLGTEGVLIEGAGEFADGMGAAHENAALLGAICVGVDSSVFVKMIGPRASVEPERTAFLEFCASLQEDR